jgi:hypothetical protein
VHFNLKKKKKIIYVNFAAMSYYKTNQGNGEKSGGLTRYQKQLKGKQGQSSVRLQGQLERVTGRREGSDRAKLRADGDEIDSKFGFDRFKEVRLYCCVLFHALKRYPS